MTYQQVINKLVRVSVSARMEPDVRRLARDIYQEMMVAEQPRGGVETPASYVNLFGLEEGRERRKEDLARIEESRQAAMLAARDRAEQFLAEWL